MTKVQTIKQIIDASGGKICSAIFIKMDGTIRKINFRLSVKKGINGRGLKYNPSSVGNMIVWEMKSDGKKCWKTIKLKNVISLKVNGVTHNFGVNNEK